MVSKKWVVISHIFPMTETLDKMVERLEEFDDVQTVYTNMKPASEEEE